MAEEVDEEEFPEGSVLYRLHRARERTGRLVRSVKSRALRLNGKLPCLICGLDFAPDMTLLV